MINVSRGVSAPFSFVFQGTTGQTYVDTKIFKDNGVVASPSVTIVELSPGLYSFTYTPLATGLFTIYVAGQVQAYVDVVDRTTNSIVKNIEDEALGSWVWDKVGGTLVMQRQTGTTLASFNVIETNVSASRERV